jgi:chorismate synthase
MSNSLGEIFKITVFGESHGPAIGVVIDNCPAGLPLKPEDIQKEVDKRTPRSSAGGTARREADRVEIISGVLDGHTTGAALTLMVRNADVDSEAYQKLRYTPRPGHADYSAFVKYRGFNDFRGGGQFSGRVTAALVMAGAVAKKLLAAIGIKVIGYTLQIGEVLAEPQSFAQVFKNAEADDLRCADTEAGLLMSRAVAEAVKAGDSLGGVVECLALNVPAGLGEPYFDTLEGQLAKAFLAVPAVKGVEFGAGFAAAEMPGSQNNDAFTYKNGQVEALTNNAGGILGGISNGMPVTVRAAVKPTPSISIRQKTVDLKTQQDCEIEIKGRHDSCIVPRARVVLENVMAVVLCDMAMLAGIIKRTVE